MTSSLKIGRAMRKGNLPGGCSRVAASINRTELVYAALVGNRATRREAKRNLRKADGKGSANAR